MKKFYSFLMPLLLLGTLSAQTLFFSEAAEGTSNNKYLEIYNPTDQDISLDGYGYPNVSNAPSTPGEYEYWNTFEAGAVVPAGGVYVVAHGSSDPAILAYANETMNYLSNGDDGFCLVSGTEDDYTVLDCIGDFNGDGADGYAPWDVAGVSQATKDHTLIRKSSVTVGNTGDWSASAGTTADDSEWFVMEQNYWDGLGSHPSDPPVGPIVDGEWKLLPSGGALQVGPNGPGDGTWWSSSVGDVEVRACLFDDLYIFNADGSFQNDLGSETWVEAWQGYTNDDGSGGEGCAAPVAPHDGSAAATWSVDGDNVTLTGVGAFLGLAKAFNGGELGNPADAPESVTYQMMITTDATDQEHLMVAIQSAGGGSGWWTFNLVRPDFVQNIIDLTFNLDMSSQAEDIDPDNIFIAGGNFFGWPGDFPMTRVGDTDVFTTTVTVPMNSGSYYTYINGPGGWDNKEQIGGQDCANADNYNDRFLEWGTEDVTINECFELCGEGLCSDIGPLDEVTVTFNVNMNHVDLADLGLDAMPTAVYATGSFEGWSGWGQELTDADMDGIYSGSRLMIAGAGVVEYKYLLGGWGSPESGSEIGSECDFIPDDGYNNYGFEVGTEDITLPPYLWGGGCATEYVEVTTLYIELTDSYGDGWSGGAALTIAGESFTIEDGYDASFILDLEDGTYSWSHQAGNYPNEESFMVYMMDVNGGYVTLFEGNGIDGPFAGTFTLGGNMTPIYEVQFSEDAENDYPSPLVGQEVMVTGVVTGAKHNGINIQDGSDTLWAGLWVYCGGSDCMDGLEIGLGDIVVAHGEVLEYNLLTELMVDPANIEKVGEGGMVEVLELNNGDVGEAHEGMLVFVDGIATDADISDYGQWEITDETGTVQVEDTYFSYQPTLDAHYEMIATVGQSSYDPEGMYEVAPIDSAAIWETLPCDDNQLFVEMFDAWGDSWNGNFLAIGGDTLYGPEADYADATLCLADGSYDVTCDGGSYQSEVSWVIYDADGTELLAGGAPFSGLLQLGESNDVLGCTDESALNYDDQATLDDGSCYYDGDSCNIALAAVAGANDAAGPAWYSYTTTMDGFLTVTSQNSTGDAEWDTDLYVYGSCDAEAPLANNDDCCGYYGPSEVTMPIMAGETYQIHWAASWSTDPFVFHILESAPPSAPQNLTAEVGVESVHLMWEGVALEAGDGPEAYLTSIGSNLDDELDAYDAKKAEIALPMEPHGYAEVFIKGNRDTRNTNVTIVCDGGSWQSEVSWEILNEAGELVANGGAPATVEAVLDDGVYTVNGYDAWGDGWNGNTLTVTGDDGTQYLGFTIESGDFASGTFVIGEQTEFANLSLSDMHYDHELDGIYLTVTNDGTFGANASYLTYYLLNATDSECSNLNYEAFSEVPALDVGESVEVGVGPGMLTYLGGYGTYEIGAFVDFLCTVPESNEDDNVLTESITLVDPFEGVSWTIYRAEPDQDFAEVATATSQEFLDTDVVGEREYCYYVTQVDYDGATPSDSSNHVCATPIAPVDVPTPTDLVAEADGWQVNLNWTAPAIGGGGGPLEDFEGGEIPDGWDMTTLAEECLDGYGVNWAGWIITDDGTSPYWDVPAGDGLYAVSNDDQCNQDGSADNLHLPPMDMSDGGGAALSFSSFFDGAYGQSAHVLVSTDGGTTYSEVFLVPAASEWTDHDVDLSAFAGESDVRVALQSNDNGAWAAGWAVDNVQVGAPADYDFHHYNVYRGSQGSEELIASEVQDEMYSEYQTEIGTYIYSVRAVYGVYGESAPSNYADVEVTGAAPSCNPPENLMAETAGNDVMLHWGAPVGGDGWMGYDNGEYTTAIGTGGEASFAVAARFGSDLLIDYDGMSLTQVQFIPNEPSATYRVMVWTADADGEPVAVDSSELLSGADLMMGEYNIVTLSAPIAIDWTTELWFGYQIDTPTGMPAGCDSGPAVDGFGNKILWGGAWANLTDLNPALNHNWSIQGYVSSTAGRSIASMPAIDELSFSQKVPVSEGEFKHMGVILPPLNEPETSRELVSYKVYRDGEFVNETPVAETHYEDMNVMFGMHTYYITAMYADDCGESEPSNSVEVDLFNTPPTAPSLVTPADGDVINVTMDNMDTEVGFIWTPAADVDGDIVQYFLEASYINGVMDTITHTVPEDMIDNPGFEDGHDGYPNYTNPLDWNVNGNHMVFESGWDMYGEPPYTFDAFDGDNSLLIWGNYTGGANSTRVLQDAMISDDNGLQPGVHVTLIGHMMTDAYNSLSQGTNHAKLSIQYFDESDAMISNETSNQFNGSFMDNVWHRFELHSEVPEGAYRVEYGVKLNQQGDDQHGSVYVDEVHMHAPLMETAFFGTYGNLAEDAIQDSVSEITYAWNVWATDGYAYTSSQNGPRLLTINIEALLDIDGGIATPEVFALHDNYPNPFNPVTNITYDIPEVADVTIEVFNLAGQRVNTLVNKQHEPGRYRIVWNATNDYGQQLASGMYIYRISAGDFVSVKKLILMK